MVQEFDDAFHRRHCGTWLDVKFSLDFVACWNISRVHQNM